MADTPLTPRPQLQQQPRRAPTLDVVAQPLNYISALPQADSELTGLINGLGSLNPALANMAAEKQQREAQQEAVKAKALAQQALSPQEVLTGAPIEGFTPPPAVSENFRLHFQEALAQRTAVQNKTQAIADYSAQKDDPNFNPQQFLTEHRAGALKGLTDPVAVATIGAHYTELEGLIAADQEKKRAQLREQAKAATATQLAADMFTGAENSDQVYDAYPKFLQQARELGFDNKQSAQFLFNQINTVSARRNGMPEMFDVFFRKQANGMSLLSMNPELAPHITQAMKAAQEARDKAIKEDAEKGNGKVLDGLLADIDNNPFAVTEERVMQHFTKFGAIQSPTQYASIMNQARDAQRKLLAAHQFDGYFDSGELWRLDAGVQGKVLDTRMKSAVEALAQATKAGDTASIAELGGQIAQAHSRSGATVPVDTLQRYIKTLTTNLPSPEGATPQFKAAAELYKALSGNPQYRDMYFNEDTSKVLEGYNSATAGGTDAKAAYVQAYQAVDPAAKAAADAFTKTPDFQKRVADYAKKNVEGSGWWPKLFGGNGRPENVPVVAAAMTQELRAFHTRNPYATDDQLDAYAKSWAEKNFVLDTTSGAAVRVPPGLGGPAAQSALSEYSKKLAKDFNLADRKDGDWKVVYVPTGTEGQYQAVLFNGMASKAVGQVSLQDLIVRDRTSKVMTPDELVKLGAFRDALRNGTPLPDIDQALVAKAESTGTLRGSEMDTFRRITETQMLDRLSKLPQMSFGQPTFSNLQFPPRGSVPIDNQLTARTALQLFKQGLGGGLLSGISGPSGPAMSLITMGEAVMLNTYDDPARGAGKNIGMGYNLQANADKVNEDLKRAGVPVERIDDVKSGKASITPDQAVRLLQVSVPRYEKEARAAAEATSPGLWDKMMPAQRAVMVDIAWQTGSVDAFKKAWASLAKGDASAFTEQTKVYYTDQQGNRKEDTRRNSLRSAMLAGAPYWEATVNKFGGLPSSKLDAVALNQQQ